jgi:DNA-binding transcriptional LysR family regulator
MKSIAIMNIMDVDLNLLVVFEAVMEARNLTVAGQRLGQAQPTVSHALNRLREVCGDPLFVRARRGVEPTPYALQLAAPVSHALEVLRAALSRGARFDPLAARGSFTLLMSDIGQSTLLPPLVRRVLREAPGIDLTAAQLPRAAYGDALQSGQADLAIGLHRDLKAGFYRQLLFEDHYICVVSADCDGIGPTMSLDTYLNARHVGIISPGLPDVEIDRLLLPAGKSRRISIRVPHFLAAPALVPGTDLVVTVPSRVMAAFPRQPGVRVVKLEVEPPMFRVHQYWHERSHHDAAHQWLRGLVAELFIEHPSRPDSR